MEKSSKRDITSLSLPAFLAEILKGFLSFTEPGVAVGTGVGFDVGVGDGDGVTAGSSVIPGVGD